MKIKNFVQEIKDELNRSNTLYCCYCAMPKGDKYVCCQENHFVLFSDLYEEDQAAIIEEELDAYETWDKSR
jgi:hypothetical protein